VRRASWRVVAIGALGLAAVVVPCALVSQPDRIAPLRVISFATGGYLNGMTTILTSVLLLCVGGLGIVWRVRGVIVAEAVALACFALSLLGALVGPEPNPLVGIEWVLIFVWSLLAAIPPWLWAARLLLA